MDWKEELLQRYAEIEGIKQEHDAAFIAHDQPLAAKRLEELDLAWVRVVSHCHRHEQNILASIERPDAFLGLMAAGDERRAVGLAVADIKRRQDAQATDADPDRLITASDAAELLAITTKHLRTLTDSGEIPSVKIGASGIRYIEADVRAFMRRGGIR